MRTSLLSSIVVFILCLYIVFFYLVFFLMIRRPPRSTRTDTLFPYTTLFRSHGGRSRSAASPAGDGADRAGGRWEWRSRPRASDGGLHHRLAAASAALEPFYESMPAHLRQRIACPAEQPGRRQHGEEIGRTSCRERVGQYV